MAARFAAALRTVPGARLAAVASRQPNRAAAFAAEHGADRAHASYDALLTDAGVDVVYVATPHSSHCALALRAVQAGRPVLVEKPFGLARSQVEEVLSAAAAHDVFVMEAMWTRFLPAYVRLRELIDEGTIGHVLAVHAAFGIAAPYVPTHRVYDPALGGGALLDLGVYPVDLACQLLGTPAHVSAEAVLCPTGVDVSTLAALRWEGGAVASAHASFTTRLPSAGLVVGTEGSLELPDHVSPQSLVLRRFTTPERTEDVPAPGGEHGHRFQALEVHRCLAEGRRQSEVMPWDDSRGLADTLDRVRAAVGVRYPGVDRR
jgi:predicted dehydrogenase